MEDYWKDYWEDYWEDLTKAERDVGLGPTPFERWSPDAQDRLARDVAAVPADPEVMEITREEFYRQIEKAVHIGHQAGFNKGWAQAAVAAHKRHAGIRMTWFIFGIVIATVAACVLR